MFETFERKLAAYQALPTGWLKVYVNTVLPLLSAFLTWRFLSSHILSPSSGWVDYGFSLAACLLTWVCTILLHYLDRTAFFLNIALMLLGIVWAFMRVFKDPAQAEMTGMMGGIASAPLGLTSQSISLLVAIVLTMVLYYQMVYFFRRWALFNMPDNVRSSDGWDDTDEEF